MYIHAYDSFLSLYFGSLLLFRSAYIVTYKRTEELLTGIHHFRNQLEQFHQFFSSEHQSDRLVMGCRHSSSPPPSPLKRSRRAIGPVMLKNKISMHRSQRIAYPTSSESKTLTTLSKAVTSISKVNDRSTAPPSIPLTASSLERTLDHRGDHVIERFELNNACLLLDASRSHVLLLDGKQLRLINMDTMSAQVSVLPLNCEHIEEIAWSAALDAFLLLTTDQLYQTSTKHLHATPIPSIQVSDRRSPS